MSGASIRRGLPPWSLLLPALAAVVAAIATHAPRPTLAEAPVGTGQHVHADAAQSHAPGARPTTIVRRLSCTPLPDVPGSSVTTVLVEFPPGAYTGPHRHPGSVTAFVVSGTVRSQMAGGPAQDYAEGRTWFEPPQALHLFAENPSPTEPATLLATFIADDGCTRLVIPEPHAG